MGPGEIDDPAVPFLPQPVRLPKPKGRQATGVSSGFVWSSLVAAMHRGEPITHEPVPGSAAVGVIRRLG